MLNRGRAGGRPLPDGVRQLVADVRRPDQVQAALGDTEFDAVAQFVGFTAEHARADVDLFAGRTGQYLYISSASAYQTPPQRLPVTEATPLSNPYWSYSRNKIAAEEVLSAAHAGAGFPVTVVRPSHTYDEQSMPTTGGWADVDRMRRGAEVVVVGDGTSQWTLTHADDFAAGFVGLITHPEAIGEVVHITSDFHPSWNEIFAILAGLLDVTPDLVRVPAEEIAAVDADFGAGLLGDKAHSFVLDNTKIRRLVPAFDPRIDVAAGLAASLRWYRDQDPVPTDAARDAIFEQVLRARR